jgi:hypothetical protein
MFTTLLNEPVPAATHRVDEQVLAAFVLSVAGLANLEYFMFT